MANVNNVNATTVFDQINQQNQAASNQTAASQAESDSQMFMELMIAQLQNQDPTSPADTSDFMQQISSMSTVESINNLNTTMTEMSNAMLTSQAALQASSMVGQNAYIKTQVATVDSDREIRGVGSLPQSVDDLRVTIKDESGQTVDSWSMGSRPAGDHEFVWNASEDLPEGEYRVIVEAAVDDGDTYQTVESYMAHTINSVTLGQNGVGMRVNTDAGSASMSDIKQLG